MILKAVPGPSWTLILQTSAKHHSPEMICLYLLCSFLGAQDTCNVPAGVVKSTDSIRYLGL